MFRMLTLPVLMLIVDGALGKLQAVPLEEQ
jgi:hypothetical protein